jgi:hypothetical protein
MMKLYNKKKMNRAAPSKINYHNYDSEKQLARQGFIGPLNDINKSKPKTSVPDLHKSNKDYVES